MIKRRTWRGSRCPAPYGIQSQGVVESNPCGDSQLEVAVEALGKTVIRRRRSKRQSNPFQSEKRLSTGLDLGEPFWRTKNRQDLHHPIAKNSLPVFAGPQTTSVKCPDIQKLKQAGCHELRPCFGLPDLLVLLTLCRLFACEPSPIAWFFAFLLNFEDTGSLLKSFQWYPFSRSKWRCLAIASTNAGGTLSPCSVKNKHSGSGSPVAKINGTPAFSTKSRPAPITNMGLQ